MHRHIILYDYRSSQYIMMQDMDTCFLLESIMKYNSFLLLVYKRNIIFIHYIIMHLCVQCLKK